MEDMMSSSTAPATCAAGETGTSMIESYQLVTNCGIMQPDTRHWMPHTGTGIGVQKHLAPTIILTDHDCPFSFFNVVIWSRDWHSVQGIPCWLPKLNLYSCQGPRPYHVRGHWVL